MHERKPIILKASFSYVIQIHVVYFILQKKEKKAQQNLEICVDELFPSGT